MKSILAFALLANAASAAAEPPCLSEAEFRSVTLFVLPSAIAGTADRCQAHLPADAYLLTGGRRLAEAIGRDAQTHKGPAVGALTRISGGKMPEGLSEDTLSGLVTDMLRNELVKNVNASDCAQIDRVAGLLAPLPPENFVGLLGMLFREGIKKGNKRAPFQICAAQKI